MPVTAHLPHRLGIILPSRDRAGGRLTGARRKALRDKVQTWFGRAFPGTTADRLQVRPRLRGRWGSGPGITIEEVEEMWVYCSAAEFKKHKPGLVQLAEWLAREAHQDAVAILVDGGMEIVVEEQS